MKKTIPEISIDSKLLYDRLKTLEPETFVSYEELSAVIGRDVQQSAYGNLTTAVKKALTEDHIVLAPVRGKGIKRLTDCEIVSTSDRHFEHVRRTSRKQVRKLGAVDYEQLSKEDKIKHNTNIAIIGLFNHVTSSPAIRKLEESVEKAQAPLAIGKTLEVFRG